MIVLWRNPPHCMLDGRVMRNARFSCNNYISMLTSTLSLPSAQPAKNRSKTLHHILSGSVRNLDTIRPKTGWIAWGRIAWGRIAWGRFCKLLRMQRTCEDDVTALHDYCNYCTDTSLYNHNLYVVGIYNYVNTIAYAYATGLA